MAEEIIVDDAKQEYEEALNRLLENNKQRSIAIQKGYEYEILYNKALIKIKEEENRNIFLLFHMNNCDGCTIMRYLINNSPDIIEALKNFEVISVPVSECRTNLIDKFDVYSFPSYFIIDKDEKRVKFNTGCNVSGKGPEFNFLNWLIS